MIVRARFACPVDRTPIENGAVVVEGTRIAFVGTLGEAQRQGDGTGHEVRDLGDAVILPGFVNAHTHLELSDLAGAVPPTPDFTDWLRRLFAHLSNSERDEKVIVAAMREGIRQSLAAGVTTVGDITRYPAWTRPVIAASVMRGVSFGEVAAIGKRRALLAARLYAACADPDEPCESLRIGVSPHAPYTVEPDALRECLHVAREASLPVCIHLAETNEEEAFTLGLQGPLAEYLRELGLWDEEIRAHGCAPGAMLDTYDFPRGRTLLAHGNYLREGDFAALLERRVSVAYCPRTHAAFGHPPHPFRAMLAAGVNVCLGTDSLASNPSLSILDEMRFLHARYSDVPADTLLAMATRNGAVALGLLHEVGTLTAGKRADLVAVGVEAGAASWSRILERIESPRWVMVGGAGWTC